MEKDYNENTGFQDPDDTAPEVDNHVPVSERDELDALIHDLAMAFDEQVAANGGITTPRSMTEEEQAFMQRYMDTAETPAGEADTVATAGDEDDESVDDIISHLLADARQLSDHAVSSWHYQSLIDEIESRWQRLKEVWPAVRLHPSTAARLEELWKTLKTGSGTGDRQGGGSDISTLFSTLPGVDDDDVYESLTDDRLPPPVSSTAAESGVSGITESVDDIIARILGNGVEASPAGDAGSGTDFDPWRHNPEISHSAVAPGSADATADDEIDALLASLGIDRTGGSGSKRSQIDEDEVRRFLDSLEKEAMPGSSLDTGEDNDPVVPTGPAAAGLSYISEEERRILDELLGGDSTAGGETTKTGTITDGDEQDLDESIEALLGQLKIDLNDGAMAPVPAAPAPRQPEHPAPAAADNVASWQQRKPDDREMEHAAAGTSAGHDSQSTHVEVADQGGNWLIPMVASLILAAGAWLLWNQLDGGNQDRYAGERVAAAPQQSATRTTGGNKIRQAQSSGGQRSDEELMAEFRREAGLTDKVDSTVISPAADTSGTAAPATTFSAGSGIETARNESRFSEASARSDSMQQAMAGQTYDPPAPEPFYDEPAYAPPPRYEEPPALARAEASPPAEPYLEPVQAYTPPPAVDVDLRPLEGALERLRNSTNDSIADLSDRVDRLERMIAGLQTSIDSLLRQSSATASESLSSLRRIQDKIVVIEEGQQKVVDATVERDGEGYTIIVNNVDGSELLGGGNSREIIHIVQKGDTLWHIAKKYINNPWRYPELARLSKIKNPDLIYPGDRVRILLRGK